MTEPVVVQSWKTAVDIVEGNSGAVSTTNVEKSEKEENRASMEHMSRTLRMIRGVKSLRTVNKTMRAAANAAKTRTLRGETASGAIHSEVDSFEGGGI